MIYKLHVIDQNNGNSNKWTLNKPALLLQLDNLLDNQKQSEVMLIERS